MPEYLKKVYEFFKTNNAAKDVLIGSVSFIAGGFVLDRILRRDQDEDEDEWMSLRLSFVNESGQREPGSLHVLQLCVWMIEYLDTAMLVFVLSTLIYLVKKTTTLCHDVEQLKKWLTA